MTTRAPAIRLDGVSKAFRIYRRRETTLKEVVLRRRRGVYEEFHALRDVTFSVPAGQSVAIIGRNGAGKSTTLKLLARILQADEGLVEVDGRVAALLELGAGFHPEYSAIENIYLSGAIHGLRRSDIRDRVDDIIAFAELEKFADNPVKTFSSGMYARLGFAIAVNVNPDVLLIDEVLAVGDQSFQARCFDRMYEFRHDGKTLVLVTHDLGAVESFCERAIWIDEGRLCADGPVRDVIRQYTEAISDADEQAAEEQSLDAPSRGLTDHVPLNPNVPIVLAGMSFAAGTGEERAVFHTGEALRVRVHYNARSPVRSPICEVEIHRHDGLRIAGSSTRARGFDPGDVLAGDGWFEWDIEALMLVPGQYYFTARLRDESGMHVLDAHEDWYRISVHAREYGERSGLVVLPGSWSHAAATARSAAT